MQIMQTLRDIWNSDKYIKFFVVFIFVILPMICYINYQSMTSNGYHLQYSLYNLKAVWVDKDGKLAP